MRRVTEFYVEHFTGMLRVGDDRLALTADDIGANDDCCVGTM
jgi:hypothetical protein